MTEAEIKAALEAVLGDLIPASKARAAELAAFTIARARHIRDSAGAPDFAEIVRLEGETVKLHAITNGLVATGDAADDAVWRGIDVALGLVSRLIPA